MSAGLTYAGNDGTTVENTMYVALNGYNLSVVVSI